MSRVCAYCGQERSPTELALLAPNGQVGKWTCMICLSHIRNDFQAEANKGCEACSVFASILDATFEAQVRYMQTGAPAVVALPATAKSKAGKHAPSCAFGDLAQTDRH